MNGVSIKPGAVHSSHGAQLEAGWWLAATPDRVGRRLGFPLELEAYSVEHVRRFR